MRLTPGTTVEHAGGPARVVRLEQTLLWVGGRSYRQPWVLVEFADRSRRLVRPDELAPEINVEADRRRWFGA